MSGDEAPVDPENPARFRCMRMIVRRELSPDHAIVDALTGRAFAKTGEAEEPIELPILRALRTCEGFIPQLSLVAQRDHEIAGHVICTRGELGGARVVGLGPISVEPALQGRGVGTALLHAVIGAADALGDQSVVLLGDPGYYARFGFQAASSLGIEASDADWGDYFQARQLHCWKPAPRRTFRYAAPLQDA